MKKISTYKVIMHCADMICILGLGYLIIAYEVKNPWLVSLITIFAFLFAESITDYWKNMKIAER